MDLADPSALSFMKFPELKDVVQRYPLVCREIEKEAAEFLFDKVRRSYLSSGGRLENLSLRMGTTNAVGTFEICVLNSARADRPRKPLTVAVGGFGPIRNVSIECSASMRPHLMPYVEFFVRSLESFQSLFEQKFIELHEQSSDVLVAGIEPLLLSVCGHEEARVIEQHCRISVTPARDGSFRFHITRNQVGALICELSSRKFEFEPDPVISMQRFLYSEEHDYFYEQFKAGQSGFLRATFSQTEVESVNLSLQQVEKLINQSNKVSSIELTEVQGFSLQISTAPKFESAIAQIISRCAPALQSQFETNVSNHVERQNLLSKTVRKMYLFHLARVEAFAQGSVVRTGISSLIDKVLEALKPGS